MIVGAGFIGSEVAVAARSRQWHATVVDVSPSPLAAALGQHAARWLWD
ncbi:NAD-binding protein [Prauserella muralis]|nr:NAD-binding protein [Prauserella muralis]